MIDIYQYTDYRKYLSDFYEAKRASQKGFTHRHISKAMGFKSSGTFAQILQGKTNISTRTIAHFVSFLELNNGQADYFELLVLFNQSKGHAEKKRYFEKLLSFPKSRLKRVEAGQYAFYEKWFYSVVREILAYHPFRGDYHELARMLEPPISTAEAQKSIRLLEELGFIRKHADGHYERTDPLITTGTEATSLAINQFLHETMDLAKSAMDRLPREKRSLSALTLSLSEDGYAVLEERLTSFRRELLELARNCEQPKRVVQVNFQLFPVSRGEEGKP